ncbi:MAG: FAD-binding oxidoreductase [Thermoplasmatales archaeon]|nr:FAD-binding oxidoreductase [Candidatus Thermoplasmatota archaeon]MCL6002677.1 FAD-binding oxidoreductase [Candidatus Thermoplasmatota archaeon]MDA8054807.1 FAD-binding oxidoreductase [Thermoplasmatales archaeon]
MSGKDFDIILVGAGIIGLASAYHLKKMMPDRSILVVEKESDHSQGNTGRSVAGFRDFFSTTINAQLARASINFYKYVQEDLEYGIGMRETGYLFLMSKSKFDSMKYVIDTLQTSTKLRVLDRNELASIPAFRVSLENEEAVQLNLQPIEVGVLGMNCGVLEIERLSSYYYDECKKLGIEFSFKTEVNSLEVVPENASGFPGEPFLWQNKIIGEISTNRGSFSAEKYVLTTGAWTGKLLDSIGVDSHIKVKKRFVYQIGGESVKKLVGASYGLNEADLFPFTVLPSHGVYLRPHPPSRTFWVSTSGTTSDQELGPTFSYESPDKIDFTEPTDEYFDYNILPVIRAYLNGLDDLKITGKWTGYYSLNTQDKTPYVFQFLNAIVATGGSGAGLMKADSIGRIVASMAAGIESTTLFDKSKIKNSDLGITERNVGIESLRF